MDESIYYTEMSLGETAGKGKGKSVLQVLVGIGLGLGVGIDLGLRLDSAYDLRRTNHLGRNPQVLWREKSHVARNTQTVPWAK